MRIVLTNDDGIDAPGLLAARQALEKIGDVLTVAPDRNRSGVGRSISFGLPLHVQEREMSDGAIGYACTGTPVDCVRLVALGLMVTSRYLTFIQAPSSVSDKTSASVPSRVLILCPRLNNQRSMSALLLARLAIVHRPTLKRLV